MAERFPDEEFEAILRSSIKGLYDLGEDGVDVEPVEVPEELRARIMAKAVPLSGMMAAAEARADGVEFDGYEPSPGGDAGHYYLTPEELHEHLFGEQAA